MLFLRLQDEHFWTRMFNVNRLVHLCEWWTEPNAQKVQTDLMKQVRLICSSRFSICTIPFQDPRYYWKTSDWDMKPFFRRYESWTRLPFY